MAKNEGVKANRNRRGTIKYARWCGGTAARAASYPIRMIGHGCFNDPKGVEHMGEMQDEST